MRMLHVIKCGTIVETKLSKISAIITASSIRFDKISYEISYFNNNEYKTAWLNEGEFIITSGESIKIGFKK